MMHRRFMWIFAFAFASLSFAQSAPPVVDVPARYAKKETMIPMRDGAKLFTAIYSPRDTSKTYPILMIRTPYSCAPYGEDQYKSPLHPNAWLLEDGYIFVMQDVRGCFMSEGAFIDMPPHKTTRTSNADVDESTDAFDTIDWLVKNIPGSNGKVGMWGVSYPGYYASAGMIDAHPALKAVSPQAPVSDWFWDDFHHNGALFLPHSFHFLWAFGEPRPAPTKTHGGRKSIGTEDGFDFFMNLGPLSNVDARYYKGQVAFWNRLVEHPNYDAFWQGMNILPHLKSVAPSVMVVGGWFDAEDLFGPLKTYRSVEAKNPNVDNRLVMGPWRHGGWAKDDGDKLGHAFFGAKNSWTYRAEIERPFFNNRLKDAPIAEKKFEAACFDTGKNEWRYFDAWPPKDAVPAKLHFAADGALAFDAPKIDGDAADAFVSDPEKPVPFIEDTAPGMTVTYMTDDQRFAARRPDVLSYRTPTLDRDVLIEGPMTAHLVVSTTETDADWIVKLIDVFPADEKDPEALKLPEGRHMSNYHMLVRSEVMRGRFRRSFEHPTPFVPGEPTTVRFELLDCLHTFKKGHRIMVQVQSTWFPLVDRNPQKYVDNIFEARPEDFTKALHRVYRSTKNSSGLEVTLAPMN